jgi:hypothetical protein
MRKLVLNHAKSSGTHPCIKCDISVVYVYITITVPVVWDGYVEDKIYLRTVLGRIYGVELGRNLFPFSSRQISFSAYSASYPVAIAGYSSRI